MLDRCKNATHLLLGCSIISLYLRHAAAGIFPLTQLQSAQSTQSQSSLPPSLQRFGYIEYQPNGTLILRSTQENGTNAQNLLLFKTVLNAMRLAPLPPGGAVTISIDGVKMYGDGVEHKFPPFLERLLQRVQTFFSVYKYADTSRPQASTQLSTTTTTSSSTTLSTTNAIDDKLETTTFVDYKRGEEAADDYSEFISIGENDGYISVGQD